MKLLGDGKMSEESLENLANIAPDPFDRRSRDYVVTLGHAPIPSKCLRPGGLDPISTKSKLLKFIKNESEDGRGMFKQIDCLDEMDARKVAASFKPPGASLWFCKIVSKATAGIKLAEEIYYKDGIRG